MRFSRRKNRNEFNPWVRVLGPKKIEILTFVWDFPQVKTIKADERGRVVLPGIKGGQVFAFDNAGNGVLTLTEVKPVEPKRPKFRFIKHGGRTVVSSDREIDHTALEAALKEFP